MPVGRQPVVGMQSAYPAGCALRLRLSEKSLATASKTCDPWSMSSADTRVVSASRVVRAAPDRIFEMIASPSRQPEWDGNDNLARADPGQRVRSAGDVFTMTLTVGSVRQNHVVEFVEGRLIAWKPADPIRAPVGHLWRWELEPIDDECSLSCTPTTGPNSRTSPATSGRGPPTSDRLAASIERLAALVENQRSVTDGR